MSPVALTKHGPNRTTSAALENDAALNTRSSNYRDIASRKRGSKSYNWDSLFEGKVPGSGNKFSSIGKNSCRPKEPPSHYKTGATIDDEAVYTLEKGSSNLLNFPFCNAVLVVKRFKILSDGFLTYKLNF